MGQGMTNGSECPGSCSLPPILKPLKGPGIWGWDGMVELNEGEREAERLLSPAGNEK